MKILTYTCIILSLGVMVYAQIKTTDCVGYSQAVDACNYNHNKLSSISYLKEDAARFFMFHYSPTDFCRDRYEFKALVACVVTAYRSCGSGNFLKLVATPQKLRDAIDIVCDNYKVFDLECLDSVTTCILNKERNSKSPTSDTSYEGLKGYYCVDFTANEECVVMSECSNADFKTVAMDVVKLLTPEACDGSSSVISTDCVGYSQSVATCNNNPRLVSIPYINEGAARFFIFRFHPTQYCRDRYEFKALVACVVTAYRSCSSGNFLKLIVTPQKLMDAIDIVCDNYKDFDIDCLTSVTKCILKKQLNGKSPTSDTSYEGLKGYYCVDFTAYEECVVMSECSNADFNTIAMDAVQLLTPEACGGSSSVISTTLLIISIAISFIHFVKCQ